MRFSTVAATAALAVGASAWQGNSTAPVYITEVVTAYTTYCPTPTEITHGGSTYTVTEATTLTISDCPCTVTKPMTSSVVTSCATCTPVAPHVPSSSAPAPHVPSSSAPAPHVPSSSTHYNNGTTPITSSATHPAGTGSPSATRSGPVATFTGAANKAFAASGAGLAAVFGFAAYVL
ncbi:hypothetical protein H2201_007255 [Coniosporium apollinis]|uniref:Clock-controlled protein 6 n=2 Tax=Coniosporium TaxID=2810619 RepID=A0ABQ9NPS5_9PEZI|nr:hypothetical protein H2199_001018 [Cladosporium sp. JES 115]KAJ9659664.1 hypothetical protein H2201_007255 [Coniosporium apollinis]